MWGGLFCSHLLPCNQHQQQWKQTCVLIGDTGVSPPAKGSTFRRPPQQQAPYGCQGAARLEAQMMRADSRARCWDLSPCESWLCFPQGHISGLCLTAAGGVQVSASPMFEQSRIGLLQLSPCSGHQVRTSSVATPSAAPPEPSCHPTSSIH